MRWLAVILAAFLCGCASGRGLKVIDLKDADRATWADPKTTFQPSESFLAHISGYGGRKVTLELWREPSQLVAKATHNIPARKTYISKQNPFVFDTQGRDLTLTERETIYWTGTDYMLRLKPLPPGAYELRLSSDDGRNESAQFTVQGNP